MLDIIGTFFIIIVGCLFHFLYDWTNHNKLVGLFSAVNESTWEHLKLVIAPTFLWLIVEYHFYFTNPIFFFAKFISLITMLLIIPLIFYSYTYFLKRNIFIIDILSFIIAIIIGQLIFHNMLNLEISNLLLKHIGIIGLIIIFYIYITRTFIPTKNFLYKDPITKKYGFKGHSSAKK